MPNLINTWVGYFSLFIFIFAYVFIIFEQRLHLKKSTPVVIVGCFMWFFIGSYEANHGTIRSNEFLNELIIEISGLFFFLFVVMVYMKTLEERNVFKVLRCWLIRKNFSLGQLFWITGAITFILSSIANNLTSALLMATVLGVVAKEYPKFIILGFINIVIAANAGGAWIPFGDITTLMVWASGKIATPMFAYLLLPALINWIVPALILYMFIPKGKPKNEIVHAEFKAGAIFIVILGVCTITLAVIFHHFLHLPPYHGMMMGLGLLLLKGYDLQRSDEITITNKPVKDSSKKRLHVFDIFQEIKEVEFDTLLFFFGILMAIGALQYLGFLTVVNYRLYGTMSPIFANVLMGIASAIVDNIPVMYGILKMNPDMGVDNWLLVTLTTGVGGSLLSIGSAAGVAAMGVNREYYTFLAHLKWSPVIALGYIASIICWWLVTINLR